MASQAPDTDTPEILPLQPGEQRVIQIIHRPDGERNEMRVVRRRDCDKFRGVLYVVRRDGDDEFNGAGEPIEYVGVVVSSDGDPGKGPFAWHSASTLEGVYKLVAETFRNVGQPDGFTVWNAPEVEALLRHLK